MQPPKNIRNVPKWINECTKIRARSIDFLEGRLGLFDASSSLGALARSTCFADDPDLALFIKITGFTVGLPVGIERAHWSAAGLAREDPKIDALERKWRTPALEAASRLVERFSWSLEARAELRRAGGHLPSV